MTICFWPHNEPRIHAMVTKIIPPSRAEPLAEIHLSLNNRPEVDGEMILRIHPDEAKYHRIGDVWAAHFKPDLRKDKSQDCFWPDHEPRIQAMITEISAPFNMGTLVEMRWTVKRQNSIECEIRLRIPAIAAPGYQAGQAFYAHFKRVSEMDSPIE